MVNTKTGGFTMSNISFIEDYSIIIIKGDEYLALLAAKKWAIQNKTTEPRSLHYKNAEDDWGQIIAARSIEAIIKMYYKRKSPTVFCIGAFHEHQLGFLEAIAPYVDEGLSFVTLKIDGYLWTYEFRAGKVKEIPC